MDDFGRFGARPGNRVRGLSAIAADGALVPNCFPVNFWHPARGVLRCQDSLSLAAESVELDIFAGHLALARDGALPVRMVLTPAPVEDEKNSTRARGYNVRLDLVGKVAKFDGDCFIVDFTRREAIDQRAVIARRKLPRSVIRRKNFGSPLTPGPSTSNDRTRW